MNLKHITDFYTLEFTLAQKSNPHSLFSILSIMMTILIIPILLLPNITFAASDASLISIKVGNSICKGSLIEIPNDQSKLGIVTAAHCLKEHILKPEIYKTVKIQYYFYREILKVLWGNDSIKTTIEVLYQSNSKPNDVKTKSAVATWCEKNHHADIAVIIIPKLSFSPLEQNYELIHSINQFKSVVDEDNLSILNQDTADIWFKGKKLKVKNNISFINGTEQANGVDLIKGDSGRPFLTVIDEEAKIAGVASCYVEKSVTIITEKTNYFAAWNKNLENEIKTINSSFNSNNYNYFTGSQNYYPIYPNNYIMNINYQIIYAPVYNFI